MANRIGLLITGLALLFTLMTADGQDSAVGLIIVLFCSGLFFLLVLRSLKPWATDIDDKEELDCNDARLLVRELEELQEDLEGHIEEAIQLNKLRGDYHETGWPDKSRSLYDRIVVTLSHSDLREHRTAFVENSGFGGAVSGDPVPRGEFRRQNVVGRHIGLIDGLKILAEASNSVRSQVAELAARLPRGKYQDVIDRLEVAIEEFLKLSRDDVTDGRQWGQDLQTWAVAVTNEALVHPLLNDRFKEDFKRLTGGATIHGAPIRLKEPFRDQIVMAREATRTLPILHLLDEAIAYLNAQQNDS